MNEVSNHTSERQSYYPQLDALRFFAVLGVLIVHFWNPRSLPWLLGDLDWGHYGVRLFFVISGFLITGILLRCRLMTENSSQPTIVFIRQFYLRRFLRIFPIYYLTILLAVIFNVPGARETWGWLVTYTTNVYITFSNTWAGQMGHFWSLAVEEHFYLVWPWVVLFAPRKWLVVFILMILPIGPLYRAFAYVNFPLSLDALDFRASTLTPGLLDTLGIGALLAIAWESKTPREKILKVLTKVILPSSLVIYVIGLILLHHRIKPSFYFVVGDGALALIFAWLICSAAIGYNGIVGKVLQFTPFVYLGKIAYGIYVYHNFMPLLVAPVFAYFQIPLQVPGFTLFIVSSLLSFALASFSWHLFELPINNLKRYFPYFIKPKQPTVDIGLIARKQSG
jgi:peptidoglycan/LPS O-acetylase OafA/YrhL